MARYCRVLRQDDGHQNRQLSELAATPQYGEDEPVTKPYDEAASVNAGRDQARLPAPCRRPSQWR